jgi:hypothetical protein
LNGVWASRLPKSALFHNIDSLEAQKYDKKNSMTISHFRTTMIKNRDKRFTVSVAAEVAEKLDAYVRENENLNRSVVVEHALRLWVRLGDRCKDEAQLEEALRLYEKVQERELYRAYYANLSNKAKQEDSDWAQLSQQSAYDGWPRVSE